MMNARLRRCALCFVHLAVLASLAAPAEAQSSRYAGRLLADRIRQVLVNLLVK